MKPRRCLQPLLAVSFGIACAHAQNLVVCDDIDDDAARLSCYDNISGRIKPAGAAVNARTPLKATPVSILSERWGYDRSAKKSRFEIMQHDANYVIFRQADRVNSVPSSPTRGIASDVPADLDHSELKFQLSAKARLLDSGEGEHEHDLGLWLAYTQQSHWQIFNAPKSRPFRETNYQPEAIMAIRPGAITANPSYVGFDWRLFNVAIVHHSNGKSDPASRSWNRIYAEFGFDRSDVFGGDLAVVLRPWYRLKEQAAKDDNPDITDFYGYGDIKMLYRSPCCELSVMGRGNARTGKGAGQIDFAFPFGFGDTAKTYPFKGYVQLFSGYGETLIDYNRRQTTFGIGVMVNDRR
jgi:phospholipase A1/A2